MRDQEPRELRYVVSASDPHVRLDSYLSSLSSLSRSQVQRLIQEGMVQVEGRPGRKDQKVKSGEVVTVTLLPFEPPPIQPEALPLKILFEDDSIIVLDKESGVVVHPAPGHPSQTLVHALLYHCPKMGATGEIFRPGIVHRLDKDTSGLSGGSQGGRSPFGPLPAIQVPKGEETVPGPGVGRGMQRSRGDRGSHRPRYERPKEDGGEDRKSEGRHDPILCEGAFS